jgi:hypothetical protein
MVTLGCVAEIVSWSGSVPDGPSLIESMYQDNAARVQANQSPFAH